MEREGERERWEEELMLEEEELVALLEEGRARGTENVCPARA
jgi:hypothetical protein